jgi:hypothetical protein
MTELMEKLDEALKIASENKELALESCFVAKGICMAIEIVFGRSKELDSKESYLEILIDSLDECCCLN